ncbi:hypothetical protein Tco_1304214 [Tanacetum coccineum]
MMTEIYQAFKSHSTPSSSVSQPTLDINVGKENVRGRITHVATEEPSSHTEGETEDMETKKPEEPKMRVDKGKKIVTYDVESQVKLVPASRVVREDLDVPIRVPYMINGKVHYLTNDEIIKHLEKDELIKKAAEQERLLAITKLEVVKVVRKEAEKIRIDSERITSANQGEKFKKAQDAELKPKKITDVKIHPHTKHVVVTVYRGTDRRNFEVHNPFAFGAFGITELDELREIIPKKKNIVVKDLMNSLCIRYKRIKKIPNELGIQSALPALVPEEAPPQVLGRKRKHMELEPEVKVPGLDYDRSLFEGVPFVNNMVIEEPG